MSDDYQFEKGDAGSGGVEKVSAGSLKKGDLVMIKGHPCKVMSFSTAKTGKHGSAKAMVTGNFSLLNCLLMNFRHRHLHVQQVRVHFLNW